MSRKPTRPKRSETRESATTVASPEVRAAKDRIQLARVLFEKCELKESKRTFLEALELARASADTAAAADAIAGLLRLAGEALDESSIDVWDAELDRISKSRGRPPAMVWYCKGAIAHRLKKHREAIQFYHRYLRAMQQQPDTQETDEGIAKAWALIAVANFEVGRAGRARWIAVHLLMRYESRNLRGINGTIYMLLGKLSERERDLNQAMSWFQRSHVAYLAEHNWYYHLWVLYAYAKLARLQKNYAQAYWNLELMDRAASGPEFGLLRREIRAERDRLEKDAVDLLIDSRQCVVSTREAEGISLRKQYVLLNILQALTDAHQRNGKGTGLSKAEIIEKVWRERYQPEAHDNKLYYNINRLRKLIEPDMKKPQYLLNWREGYRLAPGLKVHLVQ